MVRRAAAVHNCRLAKYIPPPPRSFHTAMNVEQLLDVFIAAQVWRIDLSLLSLLALAHDWCAWFVSKSSRDLARDAKKYYAMYIDIKGRLCSFHYIFVLWVVSETEKLNSHEDLAGSNWCSNMLHLRKARINGIRFVYTKFTLVRFYVKFRWAVFVKSKAKRSMVVVQ